MARSPIAFRLAVTATTLAAFPLLEIGLRCGGFSYPPADQPLSIWNPAEDRAMRFGSGMFMTAPRQMWVPRPGAGIVWGDDERINAAGYRGPLRRTERQGGILRIVVLGESCTFGYGVGYPDTFSAQLEEMLRSRGREAEVIDAGVVGYTVRQGLERYRAFARDHRPDVVVAAFGEVNEHFMAEGSPDVQKIETPLQLGGPWIEAVRFARLRLRTVHLVAKLLDQMKSDGALERDLQFRKSRYEHELREHMGEIDWKGQRRVSLDDFEQSLLTLAREVKADGAAFVMLSMPRRREALEKSPVLELYTRLIAETARREGIPLADGCEAFQNAEDGGIGEDELFGDLWHYARPGHRVLAEALAGPIEALPSDANLGR